MKYENIVFIQSSDETAEPEKIYTDCGPEALFDYLKQWDYGESPIEETEREPWGERDRLFCFPGGYVVCVNIGMPTFGLIKIIDG